MCNLSFKDFIVFELLRLILIDPRRIIFIRKFTPSDLKAPKSKCNVSRQCCIKTLDQTSACSVFVSSTCLVIPIRSQQLSRQTAEIYHPLPHRRVTHKHCVCVLDTLTHTLHCTVIPESLFLSYKPCPQGFQV